MPSSTAFAFSEVCISHSQPVRNLGAEINKSLSKFILCIQHNSFNLFFFYIQENIYNTHFGIHIIWGFFLPLLLCKLALVAYLTLSRWGASFLKWLQWIESNMSRIVCPLLVMHGTADRLTTPEGSKKLAKYAESKDKTLKVRPA